jgi:hypothetical protein
MGPKWVKMRVGREEENGDQKTEKLKIRKYKNWDQNRKKWVQKTIKRGRTSRVGWGGRGKMGRKRIINKRK